jgi:hypothetical protein
VEGLIKIKGVMRISLTAKKVKDKRVFANEYHHPLAQQKNDSRKRRNSFSQDCKFLFW